MPNTYTYTPEAGKILRSVTLPEGWDMVDSTTSVAIYTDSVRIGLHRGQTVEAASVVLTVGQYNGKNLEKIEALARELSQVRGILISLHASIVTAA